MLAIAPLLLIVVAASIHMMIVPASESKTAGIDFITKVVMWFGDNIVFFVIDEMATSWECCQVVHVKL